MKQRKCVVCKRPTEDEHLNSFQECSKASCDGTFMTKLRKGDPPMFPEPKKKKKGWKSKQVSKRKDSVKKPAGGEAWRNYNNVKKEDLATPLDETPTLEEQQALADLA